MLLAIFGIDNTGLNLAITFAILALVAIWIALIVFTFSDARRRIADPFLVACATAASFFPFVGTIVYTILRPPEFLEDVQERETEMKAAETRTRHLEASSCRKCGFPAQPDFVRCPACRSRLKDPCPSCTRPVGLKWKVCPYCEHTLIESKRSKTSSKGSSKRPPEASRRSPEDGRSEESRPAKTPTRAAGSGSRGGSSRDAGAARPGRKQSSGTEEPTRSGSSRRSEANRGDSNDVPPRAPRDDASDRPARSATRSGRRRVVVADDEPSPARTINGGESKTEEHRPGAD
jgi:hypothetical protein